MLLAWKRGEPRVCSMVKMPTPKEEGCRRIGRERKVLVAERVLRVNRIRTQRAGKRSMFVTAVLSAIHEALASKVGAKSPSDFALRIVPSISCSTIASRSAKLSMT